MGIRCPISARAQTMPDAPALALEDRLVSYEELNQAVAAYALGLQRQGVGQNDLVALCLPASFHYIAILYACYHVGTVAVPLNTRMPDTELHRLIVRLSPKVVIVETQDRFPFASRPIDLERAAERNTSEITDVDESRPALIIMTSGSMGDAKPAVLTYGAVHASAVASNENIPLEPGDRWLLSLPLYHVAGQGVLERCFSAGAAVAVPDQGSSFEQALDTFEPTHVSLVATQLYRILNASDALSVEPLKKLKAILLGGGAIPESLVLRAHERAVPIHTSFGMTETASQITCTRPGDALEKLLTSGKPLRSGVVTISGDGEVLVRGDTLFQGYLCEDGSLDLPVNDDGWFPTGDLGRFDNAGYLIVTGRKDNQFISGGENIQPEEIEAALRNLPGIEQAVVVPLEDAEFGHLPVAFLQTGGDSLPALETIREQLNESLPRYKHPVALYPWPDNIEPGMKIRRKEFLKRVIKPKS